MARVNAKGQARRSKSFPNRQEHTMRHSRRSPTVPKTTAALAPSICISSIASNACARVTHRSTRFQPSRIKRALTPHCSDCKQRGGRGLETGFGSHPRVPCRRENQGASSRSGISTWGSAKVMLRFRRSAEREILSELVSVHCPVELLNGWRRQHTSFDQPAVGPAAEVRLVVNVEPGRGRRAA